MRPPAAIIDEHGEASSAARVFQTGRVSSALRAEVTGGLLTPACLQRCARRAGGCSKAGRASRSAAGPSSAAAPASQVRRVRRPQLCIPARPTPICACLLPAWRGRVWHPKCCPTSLPALGLPSPAIYGLTNAADVEMEALKEELGVLAAPEQFFGANALRLRHEGSGAELRFDALGALRGGSRTFAMEWWAVVPGALRQSAAQMHHVSAIPCMCQVCGGVGALRTAAAGARGRAKHSLHHLGALPTLLLLTPN